MKPIYFLECAKKYIGQSEVDNRNSASRAYYAVFHICKEIALKNGYNEYLECHKLNCGDHKKLKLFFEYKKQNEIAKLLERMKYIRCFADYALNQKFTEKNATKQIENAIALLAMLEPLKTNRF